MKFLVFDLPASESGALAVLKDFYSFVSKTATPEDEWFFIVSTNALDEPSVSLNISILKRPEIKSSWIRRIYFECFEAARIVRKIRPDAILSLQNTAIIGTHVPQVVYVHQSVPYAPQKFSFFRKEERFFAAYALIFRPIIGWSVRKAGSVVVQTAWFKDALIKAHRLKSTKVHVVSPGVNLVFPSERPAFHANEFFYPTTPHTYKNIDILIDAILELRSRSRSPKLFLTITGDENEYAHRISSRIVSENLENEVILLGRITRDAVVAKYFSATLVFPSRLETFGLPLLEARLCGTRIIASDTPFAREILSGYSQGSFYTEGDVVGLVGKMEQVMDEEIKNEPVPELSNEFSEGTHWDKIVNLLGECIASRRNS